MRLNPFARGPKAYEDITPQAVAQWRGQEDAPQLLDVRTSGEYVQGHLPGARLMPLNELESRLGQLEKDRPVVVYCARGHRSRTAARPHACSPTEATPRTTWLAVFKSGAGPSSAR